MPIAEARLGLVLGGGAALGAAHVRVLQVLAEQGIRPDVVAGTSAGALVGAAVAADLSIDIIEDWVRAATWSTFGTFSLVPRLGLLDGAVLDTAARLIGLHPQIEEFPRAFAGRGDQPQDAPAVTLARGSLIPALRASIAVPGLFAPPCSSSRRCAGYPSGPGPTYRN